MKNIIKYFILSILLMLASCKDDDQLIYESITDNVVTAGGLRTINVVSPNFNFLDLDNTQFAVEVEEWDAQDGGLLGSVDVFASFNDNSPTNGDNTSAETLAKNIPASAFSVDSNSGLPRALLTLSAMEAMTALGLVKDDISDPDTFRVRFALNLTDGTVFSSTNLEGNITGVFFNSPFTYPIEFSCPIENADLFQGTYEVIQDDWADYAVGAEVPVVLGDDPFTFRILNTNNPFVSNTNSAYMEVTINPDDGSVTVSSNECFNYPGFACLDVTGTGSIGSCTGSINITINFGGFTGFVFRLSKKQ